MKKVVIFVEGKTEQVFVRHYLLTWFGWEVDLRCQKIQNNNLANAAFDNINPYSSIHYRIIDVGGDEKVLAEMKKRAKFYWNEGYEKLVGLRDLYSKQYEDILSKGKKRPAIDTYINERIIQKNEEEIQRFLTQENKLTDQMQMCFAVMETEAWLLSIPHFLEKIDATLTNEFILKQLKLDLRDTDPEVTFYRPENMLNKILQLVGKAYSKHDADIEGFINQITQQDFENLLQSPHCQSFNIFHRAVIA